ncbi:MAG: SPFH domain-containing protein [bacterium]
MPRWLDVLEYSDVGGLELVHRIPESGLADIKWGGQLIVRESQAAVFFRDGKALDAFGPGRYTLTTGNLPILSSIVKFVSGGETPFQSEVYFVNQRVFTDLKWGTKEPIVFRDAEFDMVRLRAFGIYSMRVAEPQLFVNTLVGTQGMYSMETLGSYLKGVIVSRLNDLLGSVMKSVLDMASHYDELNAALKIKVKDDFDKYGLELRDCFIQAITPPDEVQKMIDERTSMKAVGDMGRFMQYKTAKAIGDMAEKPGGAGGEVMGMGAGMGAGMMMAGMIQQTMQSSQSGGVSPGPASSASISCPQCKAALPAGAKFCAACGTRIEALACQGCKSSFPAGSKFCPNCGARLGN